LQELEKLTISNTDINKGIESLSDSIKEFFCSANIRKDAKCQGIYNLFSNEQGKVEAENNNHIKNFPQKLQIVKRRIQKANKVKESTKDRIKSALTVLKITDDQLTKQLLNSNYLEDRAHF